MSKATLAKPVEICANGEGKSTNDIGDIVLFGGGGGDGDGDGRNHAQPAIEFADVKEQQG